MRDDETQARRYLIVLPAFNEGKAIARVIDELADTFEERGLRPFEFLVVDDGSGDDTAKEVEGAIQAGRPATLLQHETNRGLGAALRTGLLEAARRCAPTDVIMTTEADGSQPASRLPELVACLVDGVNFAVATPLAARGGFRGVKWYRRILSRGANLIYGVLFPTRGLKDFTNLVRAFEAGLIQAGFERFGEDGFIDQTGFDAVPDIVLKLRRVGLRPSQVPITIDHALVERGSSMSVMRTIARSLLLCARHRLGFVRSRRATTTTEK